MPKGARQRTNKAQSERKKGKKQRSLKKKYRRSMKQVVDF